MTDRHDGLLAIWSTIDPEVETDYLHWLTREHVFERVGVPGFRSGRVFRRRESRPSEYLMLYELDDASVMSSDGYLSRLNDPTPWTQRVMPRLMRFRRGGGTVNIEGGQRGGHGSHVAIARFEGALPEQFAGSAARDRVDTLASLDWIVKVRLMSVQTDSTAISTKEKSMRRGQEGAFSGLVVIEALDYASLDDAITEINHSLATEDIAFELYDQVFACHSQA
ncbi:hypothetical protein AWB79_02261 [Caballeronia hypogeia]|uniref:Uncharacterized protein n=1 Tax=Caballeronia hypogeia TaxID=1777140 RepID=A0A158AEH3_9BURK|nr:DUF4286 family protein [Caballeronia hypogeia]SAK56125.1 hypothetical protein AWB79_02261 [Caballeronia hypogeia]